MIVFFFLFSKLKFSKYKNECLRGLSRGAIIKKSTDEKELHILREQIIRHCTELPKRHCTVQEQSFPIFYTSFFESQICSSFQSSVGYFF